jgi:hypothetical protein
MTEGIADIGTVPIVAKSDSLPFETRLYPGLIPDKLIYAPGISLFTPF